MAPRPPPVPSGPVASQPQLTVTGNSVEEFNGLPEKPRETDYRPRTGSGLVVEGDDFVACDAIELGIWAEPKTAGVAKACHPSGSRTRIRRPLSLSYSRTVGMASFIPNGHSDETTMLPLGAIAKSRELSSGSSTRAGTTSTPSGAKTLIVSSPVPDGLVPEARKIRPSEENAKPRGKGATAETRSTCAGPSRLAGTAMMVR